ncbi:High-affinity branched-chain amino acid transport ATP-binding protein LivF [bacterium HR24]|jgi:branched-chain amino acid transport system ATP-binding protein|nr:High-affinity branched-chain amino acid transport ATP-binding protein LivF [bacterium HR24]
MGTQGSDGIVLQLERVRAGYGGRPVVFDVSLQLRRGSVVALLGHNGAGKSTTLRAIVGLARVHAGAVLLDGRDIANRPCEENIRDGLVYLPQERAVFGELSVRDNLLLGAQVVKDRQAREQRLERVLTLFPVLRERWAQPARTLSGGQQRMLSVGIALMAGAKVLLLDEPSLGLAPAVAQSLMNTIRELVKSEGLSVLIVEQNLRLALDLAQYLYILRMGQLVLEGPPQELEEQHQLWQLF